MSSLYKASASRSAFSRLSAGSVVRGGPEPPGWGAIPGDCVQGSCCSDAWPRRSLSSLESVVTSLQKTTAAIESVRGAVEEVSRENASASLAEARQVDSLSRAANSWCQRANLGRNERGRHVGQGAVTTGHRLLG
jgi:hypothetical protein